MLKIIIGILLLSSLSSYAQTQECQISAIDFMTQSSQLLGKKLTNSIKIFKTTSIHSIDFSEYSITSAPELASLKITFLVRTAYLNPDFGLGQKIKEGSMEFVYDNNCDLVESSSSLEF